MKTVYVIVMLVVAVIIAMMCLRTCYERVAK